MFKYIMLNRFGTFNSVEPRLAFSKRTFNSVEPRLAFSKRTTTNSYMKTVKILKTIKPNTNYKILLRNLV